MMNSLLEEFSDWSIGRKLGAAIGLIVVIFVLDSQYWYGPRSEQLTQLQADLAEQQKQLEAKRTKVDAREEEEKRIRALQADVKRAEARLPEGREIADLLSNIAASARAVGLDLTLFRQKPETYSEYYADVPVQMEMRGTYHELALFMDRVKRLDRIVNVSDIHLQKPRLEGDVLLLEAACTATTFRFLDEQERKLRFEQQKSGDKPKTNAG